jgi:hypothetical protein
MEIETKDRIGEDYINLLQDIVTMAKKMPDVVFAHFDDPNPKKHYSYAHVFDAYRGIALAGYLLKESYFPQLCDDSRQVLENTALACVLLQHPEVLSRYVSYLKEKASLSGKSRAERIAALKLFFNDPSIKDYDLFEYLDYGWLDTIDNKDYGIEKLVKVVGLGDLLIWRSFFNKVVHLDTTTLDFTNNGAGSFSEEIIYILAVCFDVLSAAYHNDTDFDFRFGGTNLWAKFRSDYAATTAKRKLKQGQVLPS